MSLDTLDIVISGFEREAKIDVTRFTSRHDRLTFNKNSSIASCDDTAVKFDNAGRVDVMLGSTNWYRCYRPHLFSKSRRQYNNLVIRIDRLGRHVERYQLEQELCNAVPAVKDIIAERTLLDE